MATNWDAIRTEYIAGKISIKRLAVKHEVSEPALEKRAEREKWSEVKRRMSEKVIAGAEAKIIEVRVDELAEFNASDLRMAKALRAQIAAHIRAAQDSKRPMDANQIRMLTTASEAAQRIGRLALGASTENSSVTTKELPASIDEFV